MIVSLAILLIIISMIVTYITLTQGLNSKTDSEQTTEIKTEKEIQEIPSFPISSPEIAPDSMRIE